MKKFRLTLVDAAAPNRPGSMRRYGDLVEAALASLPADERPEVTRVRLMSGRGRLGLGTPRMANRLHHLICAVRVRRKVKQSRPGLVHLLDGSHGYLLHFLPRSLPAVVTVHDLIPLLTAAGELPGPPPSIFGKWLWRRTLSGVGQAKRVLADSRSTRHDLLRLNGKNASRIDVLHLPVMRESMPDPMPPSQSLKSPMLLHVGHNGVYKNREGVLRTLAEIRKSLPVRAVLVGPEPSDELCRLVTALDLGEEVEWRCDVSDAELAGLYRQADVFLFPSLYEGFGWPPLEAMAAGTPVVCSNAASLPEVVGEAALTAPPDDYTTLAHHCLGVLTDENVRGALVAAGHKNLERFTLPRFTEKLMEVYREALGSSEFRVQSSESKVGGAVPSATAWKLNKTKSPRGARLPH